MIYSQTEHPEEAKVFLRWMMEPENLAKLYEAQPGNKWPIYKSLVDSPVYQDNELLAEMARRRSRTALITGIQTTPPPLVSARWAPASPT